jgi:hypothetical protein
VLTVLGANRRFLARSLELLARRHVRLVPSLAHPGAVPVANANTATRSDAKREPARQVAVSTPASTLASQSVIA